MRHCLALFLSACVLHPVLADDLSELGELKKHISLHPGDAEKRYRLGFLMHKMNKRAEATEAYQKVLQHFPCHYNALNNLGGLKLDEGLLDLAQKYYARAARCDSTQNTAYYNLGYVSELRSDFSQARTFYEKALEQKSNHFSTLHNLGALYFRYAGGNRSDLMLARKFLTQACQIKRDALCYFNLGRTHKALQDRKEASSCLRKAYYLAGNRSGMRQKIQQALQTL